MELHDTEFVAHLLIKRDPERVEHPFRDMAAMADPAHAQFERRDHHLFRRRRAPETDLEGPPDRKQGKADQAEDRPGTHEQAGDAGYETRQAE